MGIRGVWVKVGVSPNPLGIIPANPYKNTSTKQGLTFFFEASSPPMCNFLSLGMTGLQQNLPIRNPKHTDDDAYGSEGIPLRSAADGIPLRSPRATEGIPLRSAVDGIPLRTQRGSESFRSTG